eukprot:SAG11_NODE_2065_length_3869_cov_1.739523_5_plen_20_part_01
MGIHRAGAESHHTGAGAESC